MAKKDGVTIKDVARHAGVSIAAASYALNDTGTISDATRQRVLKAAEELNYHPNAFARHLKKRKTHTIGVFITGFGGLFFEQILDGIHAVAVETQYDLIVCPSSRAVSKILTQRQVDGAIVFDTRIPNEILTRLASQRFPIVALDRFLKADYFFPLLMDNVNGVRQVMAHLVEQGARRVNFVSGAGDSFDNRERMLTFMEEADKHGVQYRVYQGDFNEKSGYQAGLEMIQAQDVPDAVFCANDQMAIGLMRAFQEHGLRIPEDVGLVGFDDIVVAPLLTPPLSSVNMSRYQWGIRAARQLIDFLEEGKPITCQRMPTRLVVRRSSLISPSSRLKQEHHESTADHRTGTESLD